MHPSRVSTLLCDISSIRIFNHVLKLTAFTIICGPVALLRCSKGPSKEWYPTKQRSYSWSKAYWSSAPAPAGEEFHSKQSRWIYGFVAFRVTCLEEHRCIKPATSFAPPKCYPRCRSSGKSQRCRTSKINRNHCGGLDIWHLICLWGQIHPEPSLFLLLTYWRMPVRQSSGSTFCWNLRDYGEWTLLWCCNIHIVQFSRLVALLPLRVGYFT